MQPNVVIDRPRFRQDLVAEPIEEQTGRFIDVMDPESGNVFRFFEVEFSLACAMDGERDVAGIVKWAQEELGLSPSPSEIRTVIATLGELGYLDAAPAIEAEAELGAGVVVGDRPRISATVPAQVELGQAGVKDQPPPPVAVAPAPELALGASGAAAHAKPPRIPVEDIALGSSGRAEPPRRTPQPFAAATPQTSEVSLDLSEQVTVGAADVKEAVRASKVMQAVDVPKDLLDALEVPVSPAPVAQKPKPPERATPPVGTPAARLPMTSKSEASTRMEAKPEPTPPAPAQVSAPQPAPFAPAAGKPVAATKPAVELPVKKPAVDKSAADTKASVPTAPTRRVSPVLIVLLIVVVASLLAFLLLKYVINKSNDDAEPVSTQPIVPPVKPPVVATPPPPPAIKLAVESPASRELKALVAGSLEFVEAARVVKRGDVLLRFAGRAALEQEIKNNRTALEKRVLPEVAAISSELEAAKASNKPAAAIQALEEKLADRRKSMAEKESTLTAKEAELSKYVVVAASDGEFKPTVKVGAKVALDGPLATFIPATQLVATFPGGDGRAVPPVGSFVNVLIKGGENKLTCIVAQADTTSTKVECPHDPALSDLEVALGGPAERPVVTPQGSASPGSDATGSAPAPAAPRPRPPEPKLPEAKPPEAKPPDGKPPEPANGSG